MNIFIIEDESLFSDMLQEIVEEMGHTVCGIADSAEEALKVFENTSPQLALIDINLKGEMNGLELGKWLKRLKDITIIYITSHTEQEYFDKAKKLSSFAFLQKPIDKVMLERTIDLASNFSAEKNIKVSSTKDDFLILKQKSKYIKINQQEIDFIEADDKYCSIYLDNGSTLLDRNTLKNISLKLNDDFFAQSHRSFLVNLNKIKEINTQDFTLTINNNQIPMGVTYKDYFMQRFLLS